MTGISVAVAVLHLTGVLVLAAVIFCTRRRRTAALWTAATFNAVIVVVFFGLGAWLMSLVPGAFLVLALSVLTAYRAVERRTVRDVERYLRRHAQTKGTSR